MPSIHTHLAIMITHPPLLLSVADVTFQNIPSELYEILSLFVFDNIDVFFNEYYCTASIHLHQFDVSAHK